jgi:transcription elongation GreA/GreB family factor
MSKAFTREDDGAGFELASHPVVVRGPVTAMGARLAAERVRELTARLVGEVEPTARALLEMELARADAFSRAPVAARPTRGDTVAFGAEVEFRDQHRRGRVVRLTSADEIGLVPHAASATSPIARALIGACVGDVVELEGPQGSETLLVLEVRFPE